MAESLFEIGARAQGEGRWEDAERAFRAVLAEDPNHVGALILLGGVRLQQQDAEDALRLLRHAVELAPDNSAAHINLGQALRVSERFPEAIEELRRGVELNDADPVGHQALAHLLRGQGSFGQAAEHYQRSLALRPGSWPSLWGLGQCLFSSGHFFEAIKVLQRAEEVRPGFPANLRLLAEAYRNVSQHERAEQLYKRLADDEEGRLTGLMGLCAMALDFVRPDEAIELARKYQEEGGDPAQAAFSMGLAYNMKGDVPEAKLWLRKAVKHTPSFVMAWNALANIAPEVVNARELQMLVDHAKKIHGEPAAELWFAISLVLENREDYEQQMRALDMANAEKGKLRPFDRKRLMAISNTVLGACDRAWLERGRDADISGQALKPVFICGMPRSGTTLLEQMICAHPDVEGAGEGRSLQVAIFEQSKANGITDLQQLLSDPPESWFQGLRESYLKHLREEGNVTAPIFTDKGMGNVQLLGLLARAFPEARFIDIRRHPMDNCFGCYRQLFRQGQEFSYRLEDCAFYYATSARIMNHWHTLFGDRILSLRYEDLVADFETDIRRVLEHCDIPWDDAVLEFHRNKRDVATASVNQVRQGLFRKGVGRWKHYAQWLDPLRDALVENGVSFNDDQYDTGSI